MTNYRVNTAAEADALDRVRELHQPFRMCYVTYRVPRVITQIEIPEHQYGGCEGHVTGWGCSHCCYDADEDDLRRECVHEWPYDHRPLTPETACPTLIALNGVQP